ncbi:hypothetical protein [Streptomyces sp. NPDC006307]|uniref:hypothetical protein n=1 Tax=Streptomyces sp. NPDC006307 TaxID=3156748 RepID=UPI0033BAA94D
MVTAEPVAVGGPKAWSRGTLREDDWLITLPPAWAHSLRSAGPDWSTDVKGHRFPPLLAGCSGEYWALKTQAHPEHHLG